MAEDRNSICGMLYFMLVDYSFRFVACFINVARVSTYEYLVLTCQLIGQLNFTKHNYYTCYLFIYHVGRVGAISTLNPKDVGSNPDAH